MVVDKLADFLRAASVREFKLGVWDCGLWTADWYVAQTGKRDPAYHLRGQTYAPGDLIRHMRSVVRSAQLSRTHSPKRGDVGIVRLGNSALGAIFTGKRWAMIGERGLSAITNAHVLAAWRVE